MRHTHPSTAFFSFVAVTPKGSNGFTEGASMRLCKRKRNMSHRPPTITTIDLDHDQMLVLDNSRHGHDQRVRVLFGGTWLTHEGESGDAFMHSGAEVQLPDGRSVLQGLGRTRVQIAASALPGGLHAAEWLRRSWRLVRRQITRLQFGETAQPCS